MGRVLYKAEKELGIRLCEIVGGTFTNVIPLYCAAVVAVENDKFDKLKALCSEYEEMFKFEYASVETGMNMTCAKFEGVVKMASSERSRKIFSFMLLSPYGIQAMSMDIPGLVQTSLNLGVASTGSDSFVLSYSIRSSILSQKLMMVERLEELCKQFGAEFSTHAAYPGWAFKKESKLRDALSEACTAVLGKVPEITATHGGLECGLFMEKIPGLDCVSLGPNMEEVHSVRERLNISSTERLYNIVCNFLENWK
jgi:dipeptidase D